MHIRGNHGAEGKLDHIARHQFGRGHAFPCAVTPDGRGQREPRPESGEGRLGAAFLKQPDRCVERQESGDDCGLGIVAKYDLKRDRCLEHPRHWRPEFRQRHAQRVHARVRHRVWTEVYQTVARFTAGQAAGWTVDRAVDRAFGHTSGNIFRDGRQLHSHAANGAPVANGTRASPLAPAGLPAFSISCRNGLMMSIGIGNTTVEFCSAPISVNVCR